MLDRVTPALRVLCLILAGLLTFQVSRLAGRSPAIADSEDSILAEPPSTADRPSTATASPTLETNAGPVRPRGGPPAPTPLPPAIQASIDRITQSEVLGPVVRPLPMALLGIAGRDAFLRAPDGRMGLLREGEELGGVKLIQIGTNRVLIEHEQQRKELMLFSGFGSESLLLKTNKESK